MDNKNPQTNLPPGFRFHPTDEELVIHYLKKKVISLPIPLSVIADVDIYKSDPWDLPAMAPFGEKEWYFFSPRDRKYPNGARPNRTAGSGYWKATGTDKIINTTADGVLQENIGVKKSLVFYKGRPPKGIKTNWIMHEYRLTDSNPTNRTNDRRTKPKNSSSMRLDDWVLCRIYNKTQPLTSSSPSTNQGQQEQEGFITQETQLQTLKRQKSCSFSNLLDAVDFSLLSSFLSENPTNQTSSFEFPSTIDYINSDQTFLTNFGNISSGGDYGYLDHKLPELTPYSPARTENGLNEKRRLIFDESSMNPSKKIGKFCGFDNSIDLPDQANGDHQHNLLIQQYVSGSNLQFQD